MSDDIRLEKDDVIVREIDEDCDECPVSPPTHVVMINFRSAGRALPFGRYCQKCAESVAERIRDGLPARTSGDPGGRGGSRTGTRS
jgi:hypothetical protein